MTATDTLVKQVRRSVGERLNQTVESADRNGGAPITG